MHHLFFLGIAGHTMGGLALAAQKRGYTVSGLDETAGPPMSHWLNEHNLNWSSTYHPEQLNGIDAVIISGHHGKKDHPVIQHAQAQNIPILSFAELVGRLTKDAHVVAVAGTHGKTTTTSLITWLLESAGQHPDYLLGIRPFNFTASSRLDGAATVVIEADEYKASTLDARPKFDYYHPDTLVLTSIEHDHPDMFPTMAAYTKAFQNIIEGLPKNGHVVVCAESPAAITLAANAPCPTITYGIEHGDFTAKNITYSPEGLAFDVIAPKGNLGRFATPMYGRHNVLNCLAAIATCLTEGISFDRIQSGATGFKGAFRRFNLLTAPNAPITVIDDYAHHPTEAQATINAAKLHFPQRRLVALYRPHTYSRTQTLLKEYHQAFAGADKLYITDVEPAREAVNQRTVSGKEIIDGLPADLQKNTVFAPDRDTLIADIQKNAKPGDVVLCMTVSGFGGIAEELAARLS